MTRWLSLLAVTLVGLKLAGVVGGATPRRTSVNRLARAHHPVGRMTLDAGYLYWTEVTAEEDDLDDDNRVIPASCDGGAVYRVAVRGGAAERVVSDEGRCPWGVAHAGGAVIWQSRHVKASAQKDEVRRVGPGARLDKVDALDFSYDANTVVSSGREAFWITGKIVKGYDPATSTLRNVGTLPERGLALALHGETLAVSTQPVANQASHALLFNARDGAVVRLGTSKLPGGEYRDITLDGEEVYVGEYGGYMEAPTRVLALSRGGASRMLVEVPDRESFRRLAVDDRFVYYGTKNHINRVAKSGGKPERIAAAKWPLNILVDKGTLYFSDDNGVWSLPLQ